MRENKKKQKIALVGNPNSGKTSLFNQLTGLQQKTGNFPGVTVEKKIGTITLSEGQSIEVIDFPGTYSFYPTASDEKVVVQTLINPQDANFPDAFLYIADSTKLEKHLLLLSQIRELGRPVFLILNMADLADKQALQIDKEKLASELNIPVFSVSSRNGSGMAEVKKALREIGEEPKSVLSGKNGKYSFSKEELEVANALEAYFPDQNAYQRLVIAHHYEWAPFIDKKSKTFIGNALNQVGFNSLESQVREIMQRYDFFTPIIKKVSLSKPNTEQSWSERLDRVLTHKIAGPIIFFLLMLLVFQAIFQWASYPMDAIEAMFGALSTLVSTTLPAGWFTDLLTDGLIAGLGGILVFVPQIAILFLLVTILEEIGYMARAVFLFDRLMQFFGLNGRSVVALISGGACAIPAVMSTRTISNWKERLITILVTPFISCSARIPVYTALIAFAVPSKSIGGTWINQQALAFMGLYLLGIAAALIAAMVFKYILKSQDSSFLMIELPRYRGPDWKNVFYNVYDKVKAFVLEAGKIILVISLILWVLSSYGPASDMAAAENLAQSESSEQQLSEAEAADLLAAKKIEASYIGHIGKLIEPAIEPLGFDWKIGIALLTSFAAREVFVGTMATIYSIGSADDEFTIKERMAKEVHPVTGEKIYNPATSWSLLLFYVFAMQCMSTLAVVKRETKSWKWPIIQFLFMTGLAYFASLIAFQLLSS